MAITPTLNLDRDEGLMIFHRRETPRARAEVLQRIRGEYIEMPGLTLNLKQAVRLWRLDQRSCQDLLDHLVSEGFLKRQREQYSRA